MSNELTLRSATVREILAELARRNVVVSVGNSRMYSLDTARVAKLTHATGLPFSCIEIPSTTPAPSTDGGRPISRAFDADQYFLDLVSSGVSAVRARRLANLAADVDALVGSLVKENRR